MLQETSALEVAQAAPVRQAGNGIFYATHGELPWPGEEIARVVEAVPRPVAAALQNRAYYFVPLVLDGPRGEVPQVSAWSQEAQERAICHRNLGGSGSASGSEMVFISTRLMHDRFSLAFEFFINAAHGFVETAGVMPEFSDLAWRQVEQNAKGETSMDAYESRRRATEPGRKDEKAKTEFFEAAFSDALAIYMLSLAVDVDYYELREREYPLLAPRSLGERLRAVAETFPPNQGYEFSVRYRRRG